ncbi:RNA polymerase sigma factor [Paenibacillus sp. OAS669]|uniref:RNA polymerase sigma factor n=1 Tax=Paenibacillus sp. OAS669 TaxID=2663821 RepID=UPI001789635D|nr:RNA polymerase sigma factor [Paenibacillus sp. OAS669]MBE1442288.1 RNA polymerase sigma-70 factor (ECF subfamily) [Paenibacillus sp. OAS669]
MEDSLKYLTRMDDETLRQLMQTYGQDVWNYAYLITKRHDAADDISQEVFVKVYTHICQYRGESSVKTWILSITRNTSFNYRRLAFFRKVLLTGFIRAPGTEASAEKQAMDLILTDSLWESVMRLPKKYREVLVLDARYDMSLKEIARLLGISEGAVKSRLYRARAKVSDSLKEDVEYGTI